MNKKEFATIAMGIRGAYPKAQILETTEEKELWYGMLKDMPYMEVAGNLKRHIQHSEFVPTIAELRNEHRRMDNNNFKRRYYDMDNLEMQLLNAQERALEVKYGTGIETQL